MKDFISKYKKDLISLIEVIDGDIVSQIKTAIENVFKENSKIYILGNGGSAATASHMVNDLGAGLARRDIMYLNIESLSDNSSVCTALANDTGYENIFYMQLKNRLKPNDLIIAISCSGNSPNILKAVEYAKGYGVTIIGVTGFDGGKLKQLSDINFHVETDYGNYGQVEDLHMILDHILYSYFIERKK